MRQIELIVYGTPVAQGSMKAFMIPATAKNPRARPILTSDSKKTKPWKQEIAGAADEHMQKLGLAVFENVAVELRCRFYFDRPKSLKKSILQKITKPDFDKLVRAVADALTGIVFKDDAQIVYATIEKGFDSRPRAEITITRLD